MLVWFAAASFWRGPVTTAPGSDLFHLSRGEGAVVELYVMFDRLYGRHDVAVGDVVADRFEWQFDAVDQAIIRKQDAVRDLLRAGA